MGLYRMKKIVLTVAMGGFLTASVNCLPSRDQINSTLNSGLLSGIQLAITLGITNLLEPVISGGTTTTDTTTTG